MLFACLFNPKQSQQQSSVRINQWKKKSKGETQISKVILRENGSEKPLLRVEMDLIVILAWIETTMAWIKQNSRGIKAIETRKQTGLSRGKRINSGKSKETTQKPLHIQQLSKLSRKTQKTKSPSVNSKGNKEGLNCQLGFHSTKSKSVHSELTS